MMNRGDEMRAELEIEKFRRSTSAQFFKPADGDEVERDRASFAPKREEIAPDDVNHPSHYAENGPPCPHCGNTIECITITEAMPFCLGNTYKYIWRRNEKGTPLKDLKKARWYLDREIQRMEAK